MKISFGKKQLFSLIILILILAGIGGLIYYQTLPKEFKRYNFYGVELEFRSDLRNAKNISVYPDEQSILHKVWDPDIYKINIVYVPTKEPSDENSVLGVNAFEIRYKLDVAYRQFNWINEFTRTELESFENITYTNDTLVIALIRPSLADETAVELNENVIYIKGKTPEEFDRATIKFLMVALNITV